MFAVVIWTGGMAFEYAALGISAKVSWAKTEYLGVLSGPVFFFMFALEYNRFDRWLNKRNICLLFIIPIISLILAWTNDHHGLIWSSFTPGEERQNLLVYGHGIWFWIGVVGYSYLLMFTGMILLIWSAFRLPCGYRGQSSLIVIATLAPLVVNIFYQAKLIPIPGLEPTPFMMVFSGMIYVWNIYYLRLLDLIPIARHTLIETMNDGMLVLETQNRVIDYNPAAQKLIKYNSMIKIGSDLREVLTDRMENYSSLDFSVERSDVILVNQDGDFLEFNISPLIDKRGHFSSKLIVVRDVTDRKRNEDKIQRANQRLRLQLAEIEKLQANLREQVIRDALTGLFNRRYLDERLEVEIQRAKEESRTIGILMIDIDHFKELNDINGHKAGDMVLKALSEFLLARVRQSDIVCRYGGEEFVIILPGANQKDTIYRAELLCQDFRKKQIHIGDIKLQTTISVGVAIYPQHGDSCDEIIQATDEAMYKAKQAGRNRVCEYEPSNNP